MKLKEDIRIASFDLDDTLLVKGSLSNANREALIKLHNCGCKIVINTGRGFRFVPDECKKDFVDYIIVSNGSRIYDNQKKEFIESVYIDHDDVRYIYNLMKKEHAIKFMVNDGTFTSKDMYPYYIFQHFTKKTTYKTNSKNLILFLKNFTPVWSLQKYVDNNTNLLKMECTCREKVNPHKLVENINKNTNASAVVVRGNSIELTSNKAGKGLSLLHLANLLNATKDNIAAFGDSGNDIDALNVAKYAIAVNNAIDNIKKAANIITDTAENDGVAKYINSIIED